MKKLNLNNPFLFWFIIVIIVFSISYFYNTFNKEAQTATQNQTFEKHSYQDGSQKLDTYDFPNINVKLEPENKSFLSNIFSKDTNLLVIVLLVYSIGLSMLFTYRERSRISKEMMNEQIKIEKERIQSKVNIYENIEDELLKYKDVISPELNIQDLDKKIDKEVNYILFSSRVILEKVLLKICKNYNITEETLSEMINTLYKKRVLDPQTNGYAHTIKAFGNRVAHPNLNNPISFNTKDVLLVLSTLVTLLNILESKNLLEGFKNVN